MTLQTFLEQIYIVQRMSEPLNFDCNFMYVAVLGEFPPVEPTDVRAKAFRGIRVDCNTPSYYPGKLSTYAYNRILSLQHCFNFLYGIQYTYFVLDTLNFFISNKNWGYSVLFLFVCFW